MEHRLVVNSLVLRMLWTAFVDGFAMQSINTCMSSPSLACDAGSIMGQ